MKKIVFLLLLFVSCRVGVQQFHLTPEVGLGLANTTGEVDSKVRPGLNVELSGDVMLVERFGIEAGVYYLMQGSKYNGNGISYADELDYINIPVYAKEFVYKGLYLFGDPQFGFNMNSENKAFSGHTTTVIDMNVTRTFDCGVGLDAGYQFERGLLVSLSYNIGLINVNGAWASNSNPKANDSVMQPNVGWRFIL